MRMDRFSVDAGMRDVWLEADPRLQRVLDFVAGLGGDPHQLLRNVLILVQSELKQPSDRELLPLLD